jgi:hypothetical protein
MQKQTQTNPTCGEQAQRVEPSNPIYGERSRTIYGERSRTTCSELVEPILPASSGIHPSTNPLTKSARIHHFFAEIRSRITFKSLL